MAFQKPAPHPVVHQCPVCQQPQTKIQRVLGGEKQGAISYVCCRVDCLLGIDLTKVATWTTV